MKLGNFKFCFLKRRKILTMYGINVKIGQKLDFIFTNQFLYKNIFFKKNKNKAEKETFYPKNWKKLYF